MSILAYVRWKLEKHLIENIIKIVSRLVMHARSQHCLILNRPLTQKSLFNFLVIFPFTFYTSNFISLIYLILSFIFYLIFLYLLYFFILSSFNSNLLSFLSSIFSCWVLCSGVWQFYAFVTTYLLPQYL